MTFRKRLLPLGLVAIATITVSVIYAENDAEQAEESGKVYRKYHPDGVVEFSDKPLRGGDELKVEEVPTYRFGADGKPATTTTAKPTSPTSPAQTAQPASTTPKLRTTKLQPGAYSSLTITSPTRDQTIRANDGNITVSFNLVPELQRFKGHQLVYLLDGKVFLKTAQPQTLKNLDRGTHTLVLQVVDKNNKLLIHSDSVSFHIKRFFKKAP